MITYPIIFEGSAEASQGMKTNWEVEASGFKEMCAVPVEFEGQGGSFSPEDFFLLALENCFVATFKVFSEYSKLTFEKLKINSKLVVDKDPAGSPMMSKIDFDITLTGVSDEKRALLLVKKTLENGFILRSVKTEITHTININ